MVNTPRRKPTVTIHSDVGFREDIISNLSRYFLVNQRDLRDRRVGGHFVDGQIWLTVGLGFFIGFLNLTAVPYLIGYFQELGKRRAVGRLVNGVAAASETAGLPGCLGVALELPDGRTVKIFIPRNDLSRDEKKEFVSKSLATLACFAHIYSFDEVPKDAQKFSAHFDPELRYWWAEGVPVVILDQDSKKEVLKHFRWEFDSREGTRTIGGWIARNLDE